MYIVAQILCIDFPLKGNIYEKSCKVPKKYNYNNIECMCHLVDLNLEHIK